MIQRPQINIWVVYDHPLDFPNDFVVRKWAVTKDFMLQPSPESKRCKTLDEARRHLEGLGLIHIDRHPYDDPKIAEVWV